MSNFVGIDLGTTFSGLAVLNQIGAPEIVPNTDGERITPSVVWFLENSAEPTLVGTEARNALGYQPSRVVSQIKRQMGEAGFVKNIDGKQWNAPEISALILSKLLRGAAQGRGKIDRAVITVPAYFQEAERKATMDAGRIAGIEAALVNEPTAAALFYATKQNVSGHVLVFDMGGGTFDASLVELSGKHVEVLASDGDKHLGGVDFDKLIVEILKERYAGKFGADVPADEASMGKLLLDAEDIKKTLSKRDTAPYMLGGPAGSTRVDISRAEFEHAISPLVLKAEMLVEAVLDEAGLSPGQVSKVLLVGGSCRIPLVVQRLTQLFGHAPASEVNVDECVALGAALHAGLTALRNGAVSVPAGVAGGLKDVKLTDVCNASYGTLVLEIDSETRQPVMRNNILLKKNTPLPCETTETLSTIADGQEVVDLSVTQGEGDDPEYVRIVHKEEMQLPPNRPAGRPIRVTYRYDENQRMHCYFEDVESGRSMTVDLRQTKGGDLTAEAIDNSRELLESLRIE